MLHFGLGPHDRADRVVVEWPDGTRRTFRDVPADRYVVVTPGGEMHTVREH